MPPGAAVVAAVVLVRLRSASWRSGPATGVVALAGVVAAFTVPALASRNPLYRLATSLTAEATARSDHLRLDLIRAGLRYTTDSDGLGTGAASFEPLLAADPHPGVAVQTWLHNSFVELLLQYGVLPTLVLAALITAVVVTLLPRSTALTARSAPRSAVDPEAGLARAEAAAALIAFVALGVVASTALPSQLWWVMLAQATASASASASLMRAGRPAQTPGHGPRPARPVVPPDRLSAGHGADAAPAGSAGPSAGLPRAAGHGRSLSRRS